MRDDFAKISASITILIMSWVVLYQASKRASTIYFFEIDSTTILFMDVVPALMFPLVLSAVLFFVYMGTKRSSDIERERELAREAEKQLQSSSALASRKVSREISRRPSISIGNDEAEQQQQRIRRLLSDIEEADIENTVRSHRQRMETEFNAGKEGEEKSVEDSPRRKLTRSRFVVENVDDGSKIIIPPDSGSSSPVSRSRTGSKGKSELLGTGRKSSASNWGSASQRSSRKSSMSEIPEKGNKALWAGSEESTGDKCDIYSRFGDIDLYSYTLSALSLIPSNNEPRVYIQLDLLDVLAELFSVHLPIWACVSCIHIILLETFSQQLSFYFYYHEESMMYASLGISFLFGLIHELRGNWITNDILAFSSIYVVCSRIQAVSYVTSVIFVIGMMIFDIFFIYVVDLLSVVINENRAPLMIIVPRDTNGNKQKLAALDIMVPGIFLNVVLKYSSMYDVSLFAITFTAVFASLVLTIFLSVWRAKTTPAMVLPAISAIVFSSYFATHAEDLWKFMIKH